MADQNLWNKEYREHHLASSFKGTLSRSVTFLKEFLEKREQQLSNLRILDCGCGNGRNAIPLAEMNNFVFGIDVSLGALREAREKMKGRGLVFERLTLIQNSMAVPLFFPDNYFDIVADITSFDILLTPEEINIHLREVRRVLKQSGLFLYYDMDVSDPYSLWLKQEGRIHEDSIIISPEPTPIPFKIYSLAEIETIFSNFKLLSSEVFRFKDIMYGREHDRAILCAIFQPKK